MVGYISKRCLSIPTFAHLYLLKRAQVKKTTISAAPHAPSKPRARLTHWRAVARKNCNAGSIQAQQTEQQSWMPWDAFHRYTCCCPCRLKTVDFDVRFVQSLANSAVSNPLLSCQDGVI
ncbi:unnamed protein product [Laminaria digitata]